jgi:uncharacterized protein YkwD
MNELLKVFLAKTDKGRDVNRSAVLALLAFVAWQVTDLRERVVRIETRLAMPYAQSNAAPVVTDAPAETISVDEIVAAALQGVQDGILAQAQRQALQAVNESRARDGLPPLKHEN